MPKNNLPADSMRYPFSKGYNVLRRENICFLGTFPVLIPGLPIGGFVTQLQPGNIGLLIIVSLLVSVIGESGF